MTFIRPIVCILIFTFSTKADDECSYASHATGAYQAVDRSNLCAEHGSVLPYCQATASSTRVKKKSSKGTK